MSGGQCAAVLELGKAPLDEIPQCIELAVDPPADSACPLGRGDGLDPSGFEVAQDGVGVIAHVTQEHLWQRPSLDRRGP